MKTCKLTILDQVNIKLSDVDPTCRRDIVDTLKFMIPHARHTPQFKLGRWDGKVAFATVGGGSYFNLLDRILPVLVRHGYDLGAMEIIDRRVMPSFSLQNITDEFLADTIWPTGHPMEGEPIMLRDHQVECVNRYLQNPQSLQSISTSAGKTIITGCLSKIVEPYGRTLVIVPGKDLVIQTWKDYLNIGLDTGRYFGDHKEPSNKHTIATWQSLTAMSKNKPEVLEEILRDVVAVIVDEAHTINGKELKDLLTGSLAHIPLRWGLTGTVPKEDFQYLSLLSAIGPQVGEVKAKDLQDKNILSNCHIHVRQLVDTVSYSNWEDERDYLATEPKRLSYLAQYCSDLSQNGNTLVLCNSVEMGKILAAELNVPFVFGETKTSKRGAEYEAINYGDGHLLFATFGVASTGINIPRIFNLVLIESGKSFTRVIQSIGRGLRTAADKDFVNIYDICSTAKFSKRHLTKRKEYYRDAEYPFTVTKVDYR